MPKKKDKNGEEFYRGKLREAEKQIRELQKSLKQLNKARHQFEDNLLNPEKEDAAPAPLRRKCPSCGKGSLSELDFLGRKFDVCDTCDYRSKRKTDGQP